MNFWCVMALASVLTLLAACETSPSLGSAGDPLEGAEPVTVYSGTVIPMTGEEARASAIAVQGDRIRAVGELDTLLEEYGRAALDRTFEDHVILPGLIDPHMHVLLGGLLYSQPFAPPWPMATPEGMMPGYPNRGQFLARVTEIVDNAPGDGSPVIVYGFHNLVHGELDRYDLDAVTRDRPLIVWHYSAHDFYLNSKAIEFVSATPALADQFHGVDLTKDGELTGRIYEDAAIFVFDKLGSYFFDPVRFQAGITEYFDILRRAGVTTTADLGYGVLGRELEDQVIASSWSLDGEGFRLFLVPEFRAFEREFGAMAPLMARDMADGRQPAPAPVLPRVKFFTDGAFYSQTMRLSPPGYLTGQSKGNEGLWVLRPDEIYPTMAPYLEAGLAVHIHSNGDAAQSATLEALEQVRAAGHAADFVIEHGGLFSPENVATAGRLDAMVSAASHYVFYMAGAYADPLGPARANWITPLGALSQAGAVVSVHSDAPLAPPQPLRAAGAHMTRQTREGTAYQPVNALAAYEALEAITLDAARVLGLHEELGSLEPGKLADFTILERDPLSVPGEDWPTIGVWGVVLGGTLRPLGPADPER